MVNTESMLVQALFTNNATIFSENFVTKKSISDFWWVTPFLQNTIELSILASFFVGNSYT